MSSQYKSPAPGEEGGYLGHRRSAHSDAQQRLGTNVTKISPDVLRIFENYDWPGNVRELANILERILYSVDGDTIRIHHLPIF